MAILIEKYPLLVQVVETARGRFKLLVHSPDFGFTMGEDFDNENVGQTELLIRRMREELEKKIKFKEFSKDLIPPPTLPKNYETILGTDLLSVSEAARLLQISRQTLWRMSKEGKIQSRETPGGHKRFLRSEIENFLSHGLER